MASLINSLQQANINVDNQQVKDKLQREKAITGLVEDVKKKEEAVASTQSTNTAQGQAISSTSKG